MPDLDLQTAAGPQRVAELLHDARPVLLVLEGRSTDVAALSVERADRVLVVAARSTDETWELPVIGSVDAASAVLIRPDGYVAWAGDLTDPGLDEALGTWFGTRARTSP